MATFLDEAQPPTRRDHAVGWERWSGVRLGGRRGRRASDRRCRRPRSAPRSTPAWATARASSCTASMSVTRSPRWSASAMRKGSRSCTSSTTRRDRRPWDDRPGDPRRRPGRRRRGGRRRWWRWISGIASAVAARRPATRHHRRRAERSNAMTLAHERDEVVTLQPQSVADGLNALFAGRWTLAIAKRLLDGIVLLDDATILAGMRFGRSSRPAQAVEPAGARPSPPSGQAGCRSATVNGWWSSCPAGTSRESPR